MLSLKKRRYCHCPKEKSDSCFDSSFVVRGSGSGGEGEDRFRLESRVVEPERKE